MDTQLAPGTFRIHRYPATLIDRLLLKDGRSVVVRPVLPQDADAEQVFVRGLSPMSRLLRFHAGLRELAPDLLRTMTEIDYRSHVALVAQSDDDGDEPTLVADARYVLLDDTSEAEFAVAVGDDWQRVGLGRQLMARLMLHARRHGVTHLIGDVLHDNVRMISLVRQSGGSFVKSPGDPRLMRARFVL